MATFPRSETTLYDLAMTMVHGFDQHAELFPSVTLAMQTALDTALSSFDAAFDAHAEIKVEAKTATIAKDDAHEKLEEQMRKVIKAAEIDCMAHPENLEYIGWSGRKDPTPLAAPAQPRELEAIKEGPGVLTLKWLRPVGGGVPGSYRIERADQQAGGMPGEWVIITNCYGINVTLSNQPRMIEMQYRVIATNPAGDSMPSSIVTTVL